MRSTVPLRAVAELLPRRPERVEPLIVVVAERPHERRERTVIGDAEPGARGGPLVWRRWAPSGIGTEGDGPDPRRLDADTLNQVAPRPFRIGEHQTGRREGLRFAVSGQALDRAVLDPEPDRRPVIRRRPRMMNAVSPVDVGPGAIAPVDQHVGASRHLAMTSRATLRPRRANAHSPSASDRNVLGTR